VFRLINRTACHKFRGSTFPQKGIAGWRRGIVVSVLRRMNEVTLRQALLVLGWVTRLWAGTQSRT